MGTTLFFDAFTDGNGRELWKSEAPYTAANTSLVKDLANDAGNDDSFSSDPDNLVNLNGTLYFAAFGDNPTNTGTELYKSNGTAAGTVLVADINQDPDPSASSGPLNLTAIGSTLYFSAFEPTDGTELWKSDGTTASLVEDINGTGDSIPNDLTAVGGTLFLTADDGSNGKELLEERGQRGEHRPRRGRQHHGHRGRNDRRLEPR